jgi:N-acetylglucosamine malate deacetylase 2
MNTPKRVLCVFAHPDDESFGPGGTIALWASQGAEIHILCMTNGNHDKMGHVRQEELKKAAEILGVKDVAILGYEDGHITNCDLELLEKDISNKIEHFQPDTLLTFNLNGVSGHLDHIAVASATTQAFRKSKIPQKLYYFTLLRSQSEQMHDYFVYFPEGIDESEADETIDITNIWETRLDAMNQHASQKHDIKNVLQLLDGVRKEYFLIRTER